MADIKVAVVGIGYMGFSHLRTYSEMKNCNVVGVVDKFPENLEKARKMFRVDAYEDVRELLKNTDVDAVSVAVPTDLHDSVAVPLLERGINVLLEKPIAPTLEGAEKIIKAAKQGGSTLMIGHVERFNPMVRKAKEIIDNDKSVRFCGAYRMNPPGRSSDSAIIDLSTHDIDVLRYILGSDVKKIGADAIFSNGTEKHVVINLTFDSGVKSTVVSSLMYPIKRRELVVLSENMLLEGNYMTQDINIYRKYGVKEPKDYFQSLMGTIEYELLMPFVQKGEPLKLEIEHFVECVRTGSKPLVTGEEGRRALEIALEVSRLCRNG